MNSPRGHVLRNNTPPSISQDPAMGYFEPIAIVGMAMRLPGRVHTDDEFWDMLVNKRSGLCAVPKDRYNIAGFYSPSEKQGTLQTDQGYYLDDVEIQQLDTSVFPIPKMELERLDPQQRQLLEVVFECMENAGATSRRSSNVGCYVGAFNDDWYDLNMKENEQRGGYRATGYGDWALANRVSYEFNLHGPSLTVKTACSSSLVCLDTACKAMQAGECDAAVVCGVNLILSPSTGLALRDQGLLSPTGTCKTFDASADGYGRGEAVTAVYIKPLTEALRDRDHIRAVIRGTGVNCDGRTNGMTLPNSAAQERLIRRVYQSAGIADMSQTAVVECHGTGTPVGDPLEMAAVAKCFGKGGIITTSVKPNVGHSEGAAGLTSLIKAVLALEHQTVPPNILFNTPNPAIPFEKSKLHVPVDAEPWPQSRAERMSINSFGLGGVNAHVVLDSARQLGVNEGENERAASKTGTPHLLVFSAGSPAALTDRVNSYEKYLSDRHTPLQDPLQDISYTLSQRREHGTHRAYAVTNTAMKFEVTATETIDHSCPPPQVVWVFNGQGSQWPGMGARLIDTYPVFARTVRRLDRHLLSLPSPPGWKIEDELRKSGVDSRVHEPAITYVLTTVLQVAMVDVLRSWGITPDAVVGHSSGEFAAAYASGAISAKAAVTAAALRGSDPESGSVPGAMAAVSLGGDEVATYLEPGVVIACENSHCNVTLSGDEEQVKMVARKIKDARPDVLVRFLRVKRAYHSHHMNESGPIFERQLQEHMKSEEPRVPFYSSVLGDRLPKGNHLDPAYWRRNMEGKVRFNSTLRSLLEDHGGKVVLIEIGPHPALQGPIAQIIRDTARSKDIVHLGTLERGQECEIRLLELAGKLFQHAVELDFSTICPAGKFLNDLPRYPWRRDVAHFKEPRLSSEWRFREYPPHELLGSRMANLGCVLSWRNMLSVDDVPWLLGHRLNNEVVFPGAAYVGMVGEALRQTVKATGYTLRDVTIKSAIVLDRSETIELVTTLKSIDSAPPTPSSRFQFAISSHSGGEWIENCTGEVMTQVGETDYPSNLTGGDSLCRKVDEKVWYKAMDNLGFHFTEVFTGLQDICTSVTENRASATSNRLKSELKGEYTMHPVTIDRCFQVFMVASCRGLARNIKDIFVPTDIEEIVICDTEGEIKITAEVELTGRGSYTGKLLADGPAGMAVSIKGFSVSALTRQESVPSTLPIITTMEWMPSSDFTEVSRYMGSTTADDVEWSLLEELTVLCCLDHQENIHLTDETPEYLAKLFLWMEEHTRRMQSGPNEIPLKGPQPWNLDRNQRLSRIKFITTQLGQSSMAAMSTAIYRLFQAASSIFAGAVHPLNILTEDNCLGNLYDAGDRFRYADLLQVIAHTNPKLRILEVGAGTGGTTAKILNGIESSLGEAMYTSYTFTDVSAGFIGPAKERFAGVERMDYAVLDISRDPAEQGFELGSYDLIVGSNVVHATPSLQTSLVHLRSLLHPSGRLILTELCPDAKFINYIMGFLPGWWLGDQDNRAAEAYIPPERWTHELMAAGYKSPEAIILDSVQPYHLSAAIVASPRTAHVNPTKVTLLSHARDGPHVTATINHLQTLGISIDTRSFGETCPPGQDIISWVEFEDCLLHNISEASFRILVEQLTSLGAGMVWVLPSSQVLCKDPRAAMVLGLLRTARTELSCRLFTVEIDDTTPVDIAAGCVCKVLLEGNSSLSTPGSLDPDWEFAVVNGEILVPRCHWQTLAEAFTQCEPSVPRAWKTLQVRSPGLLQTLEWADDRPTVLGDNEVTIQTKALGLNFRDILVALGAITDDNIGFEACGIVKAVGTAVHDISVGDRVVFMTRGSFSTYINVPRLLCARIDTEMTYEEGASLACVFSTAILALVDHARMRAGQTVLIHSACGGVGLAAMQVARLLGAEIYCTVGSEEKVQYLIQNYQMERSHIFSSRDASFLGAIMRETNGRGVDVVLNSLAGDLLQATWKCVAEFGMMIEIGKQDFKQRSKLGLERFEQNRAFVGLDLSDIVAKQPERTFELLTRCIEWASSRKINPGPQAYTFPAAQVREAFRFMQPGNHIGKIVIRMPDDPLSLESVQGDVAPTLRANCSYLLVGGLGGLGQVVAHWMVQNGARYLVFLSPSRRENDEQTQVFLRELQAQGCYIQVVSGSVANLVDVQHVVQHVTKPIAGVINMAMVIKDKLLANMTFTDWSPVVDPKVQGTWNLHSALAQTDLDFFVLFSSYAGIVGGLGQASYSAASTFLDAFVQYRHSLGLPASVIDVGAVGEVGYLSKHSELYEMFQKLGYYLLQEQDVLGGLALAIKRSNPRALPDHPLRYRNPSQIMLGLNTVDPIASVESQAVWKNDRRMAVYHNISNPFASPSSSALPSRTSSLKEYCQSAYRRPDALLEENATTIIAEGIGSLIAGIMLRERETILLDHSVKSLGVDSLVSMELRNIIRQQTEGVDLSVFTISHSPSLMALGDVVRKELVVQLAQKNSTRCP